MDRSPDVPRRTRGRPPAARPDAVVARARELFLAGERLDMTALAEDLGLGRATIYRWFGSREQLQAEVLALEFEALLQRQSARVGRRGAVGLLEVLDRVNQALTRSRPLQTFLEQEQAAALRLLTSGAAPVQPRAVEAVRRLIDREIQHGRYVSPADPQSLAYALVRLGESFLYNDAVVGIRGDHQRLREIETALLGLPTGAARAPATSRRPARAEVGLRPLATGDEAELLRIHRTPGVRRWWDEPAEGFPWEEPEATRFTIEVDGSVAGMIQYWEENEPRFRHAGIDVFLDPRWHGQGIGREVVRRVLSLLIEDRGHHRVTIDPAVDNAAAVRSYSAVGFRPVGVLERAERDTGASSWHDVLLMEFVADPTAAPPFA